MTTAIPLSQVASAAGMTQGDLLDLAARHPFETFGIFTAGGTHYAYTTEARAWLQSLYRDRARNRLRPRGR